MTGQHVSQPWPPEALRLSEAESQFRDRYTVPTRVARLEEIVDALAARLADLERAFADMRRQDQR